MEAEWYKIRDLFCGENYVGQDIEKALALAKNCKHPDAVWLSNVMKNVNLSTVNWLDHFMSLDQTDARTFYFAWHCQPSLAGLLKRSADMGYAFAQAKYQLHFAKDKTYAEAACKQGERDGFHALARYYALQNDMTENYWFAVRKAADLGYIDDIACVGDGFAQLNQEREAIIWYGKAALVLKFALLNYCRKIFATTTTANKYLLGKYAKLLIKKRDTRVWSTNSEKEKWKCAKQASTFYDQQVTASRNAVQAWSICAKRLNIIKDMRVFIAKLVWKNRKLGLFTC